MCEIPKSAGTMNDGSLLYIYSITYCKLSLDL